MLKILVYAYLNNVYSGRQIERQLQENIPFIWLFGGAKPDFRTINYFRSKRLKNKSESIFTQVVMLLHGEVFVTLDVQYIDSTKIESAANKYSFVWRGSVEKNDTRLKKKLMSSYNRLKNQKDWNAMIKYTHLNSNVKYNKRTRLIWIVSRAL